MKAFDLLLFFFGMIINLFRVNVPGFNFNFLELAGAQIGLVMAAYFIKLTLGFGGASHGKSD